MKKTLIVLFGIFITSEAMAQGSFDFSSGMPKRNIEENFTESNESADTIHFKSIKRLGLVGIGNLNTESFTELNSSGKLSGYLRPYRNTSDFVTLNFAFNVNASNSDSLLASTFLFPDVGRNSFFIGVDYSRAFARTPTDAHLLTPFAEFSLKSIKAEKKSEDRYFNTLSTVIGLRYQYYVQDKDDQFSFTASAFFSSVNVPDEDEKDYRYLFTDDENSKLASSIKSFGVKTTFQINHFQIFADLRHVFGSEEDVPVRELRGFNSNIGVIFNAKIFEK